jgi:SOS-response transcriptional repressor LexA
MDRMKTPKLPVKNRNLSEEEMAECAALKGIYTEKKSGGLAISHELIAGDLGISQGAVSHYLNGINALNSKVAAAFSRRLCVPISDFSGRLAAEIGLLSGLSAISDASNVEPAPPGKKFPLIDLVKAGDWCQVADPYPVGDAEDYKESPFDGSEKSFLLRVDGNSMYHPDGSGYSHGEIIHVDPTIQPSHGKDVVVRSPDGKATFKRYMVSPEGVVPFGHATACPANNPNTKTIISLRISISPEPLNCGTRIIFCLPKK